MPRTVRCLSLGFSALLSGLGCDSEPVVAEAQVTAEVVATPPELQAHVVEPPVVTAGYTIERKAFDLEATLALAEREEIESAAELEVVINADDSPVVVDVDRDGARDFIQVYELPRAEENHVSFEFRAVASSHGKVAADAEFVALATADFRLDPVAKVVVVEGRYTPVVVDVTHDFVVTRTISIETRQEVGRRHVVVGAPFVAWVWLDARPVFVGHVHLPPGHAKKLGLSWHGHGHAHGHGHHRHGAHGKHGAVVHGPSAPSFGAKAKFSVHAGGHHGGHHKVKAHHGGGHASFKVKAGGHASHGKGGKSHGKKGR